MNLLSILIPIAHAAEAATANNSPIAVLGLDWKLFIAQLVNFGIVLFILWKWVFTPVTAALQKRTAKIEQSLKDAEKTTKDKEEFEKWKQEQMVNTRHEATIIIGKAQADATKAKDEIIKQAQEEQQKVVQDTKKQIEIEKQKALGEAKQELANLVTMASEKIIRGKLDSAKDKELIRESLKSFS